MGLGHVDEAAGGEAGLAALPVADADVAAQHAGTQVEGLAKGQDFDAAQIEPVAAGRPEAQRQPVRHVDQVFVLDHAAGDLGLEPIVAAGEIGAGIVQVVGAGSSAAPRVAK
jgi:hypothetical protein